MNRSVSGPSDTKLRQDQPGHVVAPIFKRATGGSSVAEDRTIFTAFSLLAIFLIGLVIGQRAQKIFCRALKDSTVIQVLIMLLYLLSLAFVLSAALLESGVNLQSISACRAAIYCCVSFYFLSKGVIQIFLAERAHAVRARHPKRLGDPVWITCMCFIVIGFGAIMILAFVFPVAQIGSDNICRIGLPIGITIPMLTYDILVNAGLTGVFVWLLQPMLKRQHGPDGLRQKTRKRRYSEKFTTLPPRTVQHFRTRTASIGSSSFPGNIEDRDSITSVAQPSPKQARTWVDKLVLRSMVGAGLVLLPTLANLGLLTHVKGKEQGWECFTFCTLDVTWSVLVLTWLTTSPSNPPAAADDQNSLGVA